MYTNKNIDEGIPLKAFKSGFWIFIVISMLNPVASANVGIALFYLVPVIAIESDFARKEKVKSWYKNKALIHSFYLKRGLYVWKKEKEKWG